VRHSGQERQSGQLLETALPVASDLGFSIGTCGKDGQSMPVGLGLPTVKVRAINVGGVN
jgi:TldD protein